jgi:hypothetical protein
MSETEALEYLAILDLIGELQREDSEKASGK